MRAFVLAVATGQVLGSGALTSVSLALITLLLIAAACSTVELRASRSTAPWVPVLEGVMVAALLGPADVQAEPLLIYLAVPPIVAGIRHGLVTTTNTSLATSLAVAGAWTSEQAVGRTAELVPAAIPWLVIGLGVGLLAAWQTRAVRSLEANQAPYAAAHRLVSQLHSLANRLPVGLDSVAGARDLRDRTRARTEADRCVLLARSGEELIQSLVPEDIGLPAEIALATDCLAQRRAVRTGTSVALPLRVGELDFGAAVLTRGAPWSKQELSGLQELLDEHAVRLDTALLFDEVRTLATSEERNRLARDIHDGVAQEIASLGYLADEISASAQDTATRKSAAALREDITRVIGELRFSIFDLRHDVAEDGDLSGALAEYVRALSASSELRIHLMLDERGPTMPRRTEAELLRIAREAITNVRKHAHAINLWITLSTDSRGFRLLVEDDGVGGLVPREGHYGLHSMRERAERIDADLTVGQRLDGGTTVTLQSRAASAHDRGERYDDHRPARR